MIAQKERYQKHKEELKIERDKPENKEKMKLYMKEYNQRPEVILKKEKNREKMKLYMRESYQKNNPLNQRWLQHHQEHQEILNALKNFENIVKTHVLTTDIIHYHL